MKSTKKNRFQDFFEDEKYISLKNYLYNYLIRKRAIEKLMQDENKGLVLEIGSGISPVLTYWDQIVYSDLSFSAIQHLRNLCGKGHYVVADSMYLPFKTDVFTHVISSEVMEHLHDDSKALREIAEVIKHGGAMIVTFPHRHFYFSCDDRFVNHYRRYEIPEMASKLQDVGLHPITVRKVLGPLEKITMIIVTRCIIIFKKSGWKNQVGTPQYRPSGTLISLFKWANKIYARLAWVDAFIVPRALSTVLLIKAIKNKGDG
jgi:SAM-dependent methyltransferase